MTEMESLDIHDVMSLRRNPIDVKSKESKLTFRFFLLIILIQYESYERCHRPLAPWVLEEAHEVRYNT